MKLDFFAGVEYQNKIFFSAFHVNGLFVMDIETREVRFLKLFEKEKMKKRLHRAAFIYGKEAWFIPQEAEYIACVNLESLEVEYHRPPYKKAKCVFDCASNYHLYFTGYVYEHRYLYLVPADIDTFSVVDMETHEITPVYEIEEIDKKQFTDALVIENELWMIPRIGDELNRLNLNTGKMNKEKWMYPEYSYSSVALCNGKLWFAPNNAKKILCIDLNTDERTFLEIENSENRYSGILKIGNDLIFLSTEGNDFVIVDTLTSQLKTDYIDECQQVFRKQPNKISVVGSVDKHILTTGETAHIIVYGESSDVYSIIPIDADTGTFSNEIAEAIDANGSFQDAIKNYESGEIDGIINLERYIKMVLKQNLTRDNNYLNIGNTIWNNLKNVK